MSGDSDRDADDHGKNSGIAGSGYCRYFNGKIPAAACEYDRRPLHGQQQASGVPSAGVQLRCDSGFPVGCVYDCSSGGD